MMRRSREGVGGLRLRVALLKGARLAVIAGCSSAGALLSGCSSSAWSGAVQRVFPLSADTTEVLPSNVRVQQIPWPRMAEALAMLEGELAASEVHASAWTDADRLALGRTIAPLLQLPAGAEIVPLATTGFGSSARRADEAGLARTAAKAGADVAVWARVDDGVMDVIVQQPVTQWTHGSVRIDGDWRPYSESTTAWVPVRTTQDRERFAAVLLRSSNGGVDSLMGAPRAEVGVQ